MGEEGEATLGKSFTESACRGEVGTEDRRRRRRLGERGRKEEEMDGRTGIWKKGALLYYMSVEAGALPTDVTRP
jgi:hypothetical protein